MKFKEMVDRVGMDWLFRMNEWQALALGIAIGFLLGVMFMRLVPPRC